MTPHQIIHAWKNPQYRATLTSAELASYPEHPASYVELPDEMADDASGGTVTIVGDAMSVWPSCESTMWDGTCNVATVGCCKPS